MYWEWEYRFFSWEYKLFNRADQIIIQIDLMITREEQFSINDDNLPKFIAI